MTLKNLGINVKVAPVNSFMTYGKKCTAKMITRVDLIIVTLLTRDIKQPNKSSSIYFVFLGDAFSTSFP